MSERLTNVEERSGGKRAREKVRPPGRRRSRRTGCGPGRLRLVRKTPKSAHTARQGGHTHQQPQNSYELKKITPPKTRGGPLRRPDPHSLVQKNATGAERVASRPLVPTWHAPRQHWASETARGRAVVHRIGETTRGEACRASAVRARAAEAPISNPLPRRNPRGRRRSARELN